MNWTAALLFATCLQVSAAGYSQGRITLSLKNAPLQKVFAAIKSQSGYTVWYDMAILKNTTPIDIDVKDVSLEQALNIACENQSLEWTIVREMVVVRIMPQSTLKNLPVKINVKGRVFSETGEPVSGVSVTVQHSDRGTVTDGDGFFEFVEIEADATLIFSGSNIETLQERLSGRTTFGTVVRLKMGKLDEVQIIGYGTIKDKFNTGNVTSVTSEEIEAQPVSNPLQTLAARVPGMLIQSNSGIAGDNLNIQIQAVNSIAAGTSPLYVIDGVPFGGNSLDLISISSGTATPKGLNPLNSINPNDIESISILKDADATGIYGSRGANGVVLITTKRGRSGKTKAAFNIYSGIGQVGHFVDMMNIQQYLQLRKKSLENNGIAPTTANAPDLLVWDTTKNTNWQQKLIGGNNRLSDVQMSISGGDTFNRFLLGGSYHHEGSVFPASMGDGRETGYLNFEHGSETDKFYASASVNFSTDQNNLIGDPTPYLNLPPNDPIYNNDGSLIWRPNNFSEPYSFLATKFNTQTNNLISDVTLQYKLPFNLTVKANLGYTQTDLNQNQLFPSTAQNPAFGALGYSYFEDNHLNSWILEPQINYNRVFRKSNLNILVGGTWQQNLNQGKLVLAENYNNDALLENIANAGDFQIININYSKYDYNSFFSRVTYTIKDKYLLNGSFRRDGSSRFGSGKQFGNFGSFAVGWIFSGETFVKQALHFLSFGKLKGTYGITGNDQIPDYQFLSTYVATTYSYQIPGLRPARIANPDYSWETTRKLELSLELGFVRNRILISATYFRNRSGNQLVSYPLPSQSGFSSYQSNLPALIQNTGWEFNLNCINLNSASFKWNTNFNLTIPRNKLISFPGLAGSSYGTADLVIGQPLNLVWGYHYQGVDTKTGLANVEDIDHDGNISYPGDYVHFGTTLPDFYGGLSNTIEYKHFQLNLLFQFVKKIAQGIRAGWYSGIPGKLYNQEELVWNRIWMQPNDKATLPKPDGKLPYYYAISDAGAYEDASYIKLKALSLVYKLNGNWTKKIHLENLRVFIQGENLFTITSYSGFDPEAYSSVNLPNLRVITGGIHFEL